MLVSQPLNTLHYIEAMSYVYFNVYWLPGVQVEMQNLI